MFILFRGVRVSEVVKLKPEDTDAERKTHSHKRWKGKKGSLRDAFGCSIGNDKEY